MLAVSVRFVRAASVRPAMAAPVPLSGTEDAGSCVSAGDDGGPESGQPDSGPRDEPSVLRLGRAEGLDAHRALQPLHHMLLEELVALERSVRPGRGVVAERRQPRPSA